MLAASSYPDNTLLRFPPLLLPHPITKRNSKPTPLPRPSPVPPKPQRNKTIHSSNSSQNRPAHIAPQALEHLLSKHGEHGAQDPTDACQRGVCGRGVVCVRVGEIALQGTVEFVRAAADECEGGDGD